MKKLTIIYFLFVSIQLFAQSNEELITAIQTGNLTFVEQNIKNKKQANKAKKDEFPPLYIAANSGQSEIAIYLIGIGADILWSDNKHSIIHAACAKNLEWLVADILSANKQYISLRNIDDRTPLHIASHFGSYDVAKLLIEHGSDVNAKDEWKSTILNAAIYGNHLNIVKLLVNNGANIELLNSKDQSALFISCESHNFDIAAFLLENGADINKPIEKTNNSSLLYYSLQRGKPEIVVFCLLHGASFDEKVKIPVGYYTPGIDEYPLNFALIQAKRCVYNDCNWIDVANVMIETSAKRANLDSLFVDAKSAIDIVIQNNFPSVAMNMVYHGNSIGLLITTDKGEKLTIAEYIANSKLSDLFNHETPENNINNQLFDAISAKDLKQIKQLIKNNPYYTSAVKDLKSKNGYIQKDAKPLMHAINTGNIEIVKSILSLLNDRNMRLGYDIAAANNDVDMFKFIMKNDDKFEEVGKWTLYRMKGKAAIFNELLLKTGIDPDQYIFNGMSYLFYVTRYGNAETVKVFIKYSKVISNDYKNLFQAIEKSSFKNVEKLLLKGLDINHTIPGGLTPLCWACYLGNYDMAKLLIKHNADVSIQWQKKESNNPYPIWGSSPLRWAIEKEQLDIVQLLIQNQADPLIFVFNKDGLNIFHIAAIKGNTNILKILLKAYDGKNEIALYHNSLMTPFDLAASKGHTELCILFMDSGLSVDNSDKEQFSENTPLLYAVRNKQLKMVQFLIDKGADVNKCISDNKSILYEAAYYSSSEIVKLLIEKGADVNFIKNEYKTVLQVASTQQDIDMIRIIVDAGADITVLDKNGCSILHNVLRSKYVTDKLEITKYLLAKKLDVNVSDKDGITAIHIAVMQNNSELIQCLIDNGADLNSVILKKAGYSRHKALRALDLTESYSIYKLLKDNGAKGVVELIDY